MKKANIQTWLAVAVMIVSQRKACCNVFVTVGCCFFSMFNSSLCSFLTMQRSSIQPPESSAFWSASLLTRVRQLAGFYRSHRGMWSQTDAMPLSVPPVPEGAGDYELIPSDFWSTQPHRGTRAEQQTNSHTRVFTQGGMLQFRNGMLTEML